MATLKTTKNAEREGEAAEVARIKARGAEARRQTQAVRNLKKLICMVGEAPMGDHTDRRQLRKAPKRMFS